MTSQDRPMTVEECTRLHSQSQHSEDLRHDALDERIGSMDTGINNRLDKITELLENKIGKLDKEYEIKIRNCQKDLKEEISAQKLSHDKDIGTLRNQQWAFLIGVVANLIGIILNLWGKL